MFSATPNSPTLAGQFLSTERFAWVMDIGESTEKAWRDGKLVTHFTCGRIVRYDPAEVLRFIARHSRRARAGTHAECGMRSADWERIERLIAEQVRAAVELRVEREAVNL